jgi:hypothetical protein
MSSCELPTEEQVARGWLGATGADRSLDGFVARVAAMHMTISLYLHVKLIDLIYVTATKK